ncbi:MAG: siroheme synthase [Methanoculleus sp. SDB]|nr:MAG: siroheme synthase [Methanoculleus sp. SDB]
MIPLMLNLHGRRVVIFGGGEVGRRKAAHFLPEADVLVVSRSFHPGFEEMPLARLVCDLDTVTDAVLAEMLSEVFLAVAATPAPALNARIGRLCRAGGVLFNDAGGGVADVTLPAVARGKNYIIAVSTGGSSPAVARWLRRRIEDEYAHLDGMIALQQELRTLLREKVPDQGNRTRILRDMLNDDAIWAMLATHPDEVRNVMIRKYVP